MKKVISLVLTLAMLLSVTGLSFGAASTSFKSAKEIYGVWTFSGEPGAIIEITAKESKLYTRETGTATFKVIASNGAPYYEKNTKEFSFWFYVDCSHNFRKDSKGRILMGLYMGDETKYVLAKKHKSVKEASAYLLKDKKIQAEIANEKVEIKKRLEEEAKAKKARELEVAKLLKELKAKPVSAEAPLQGVYTSVKDVSSTLFFTADSIATPNYTFNILGTEYLPNKVVYKLTGFAYDETTGKDIVLEGLILTINYEDRAKITSIETSGPFPVDALNRFKLGVYMPEDVIPAPTN